MNKGSGYITTAAALLLLSYSAFAVDVDVGDEYDYDLCVARNTNICLNQICLTSEDLECSQKCKEEAQQHCKQSGNTNTMQKQ